MATHSPGRRAGTAGSIVSIELGASAVRAVEADGIGPQGSAGARIARRGSAPLPPHVWHDPAAHQETLAAAIREALAAGGIVAKSVVACLPRRLVTLRFAQLPAGTPEQLRGMVAFEAQQYIPFPLDEVILDHAVIREPGSNGAGESLETVLIAAARRSLVLPVLAAFDRAGLELSRLSVSALALAEHGRDALAPTALLDIEPGEMDVAIVANGRLLFTRASPLHLAAAQPEAAARLAEEAVRSLTAYQNEFRHHPLHHVALGGPGVTGAEAEAFQRALSETLELPVERIGSRLLPVSDPDAQAYATACGLALQSGGSSLAPINLVPEERAQRRALEARKRAQGATLVVTLALAALLVFAVNARVQSQRKARRVQVAANETLRREKARQERVQQNHARQAELYTTLRTGLDRAHPAVDVLAALNAALPKTMDIWLTQFDFERGGPLTLRGNTRSERAATQLVMRLQDSGAFSEVRLGYLGDAQEEAIRQLGGSPTPPAPSASSAPILPPMSSGNPPPGNAPGPSAGSQPGGSPGSPPGAAPSAPTPPGRGPGSLPTGPPANAPGSSPGRNPAPAMNAPGSGPASVRPGSSAPASAAPRPGGNPGPASGVTRPPVASSNQATPNHPAATGRATAPNRAAPARPRSPGLTTFIITCRVNPRAADLLSSAAVPAARPTEGQAAAAKPQPGARVSSAATSGGIRE